ncbi:DEKNAAC101793 [Brettanomyces naardenensis]|uniref:DNA polymerase n=1 Tax=Brettanomyces naardenensis TaxID=13370 RepID=A0A448YJA7_BRENA|nr:DEKNAAC101793 [Brettanomyces naardenensis]
MSLLKGLQILLIPRVNTSVEKYRLKIWRDQGADIKDLRYLRQANKNAWKDLHVVVNDLAKEAEREKAIEKIKTKDKSLSFVKTEWLLESLNANKVLSPTKFLYEEVGATVGPKQKRRKVVKDNASKEGKLNQIEGIISILTRNRDHRKLSDAEERHLRTNSLIAAKFREMIDVLQLEQLIDSTAEFRVIQYRNALNTIQTITDPIRSGKDLQKYYGFGKSLQQHVDEIIQTGTFVKLEHLKKEVKESDDLNMVAEVCEIHGFGPVTAYKLVKTYDIKKVSDLVDNEEIYKTLSYQQKIGLKYREDWLERMQRSEVTTLYERILEIVKKNPLVNEEQQPEIRITGSYLRGSKDCGDIDLILFQRGLNDTEKLQDLLYKLVTLLKEEKFINCELTEIGPNSNKFNGGCVSGAKCRRIDIIAVEYQRLGAAMIYFVGNDTFNRGVRLIAGLKGMHLSDRGLTKIEEGKKDIMIESFDERKILDLLGVGWVEYTDRNV